MNYEANSIAQTPQEVLFAGRSRWVQLLPIAFITYTIAYFDRANIGLALPHIVKSLGLDATQAGMIGGAFSIGYAVTQLLAGWITLKMGPRNVIGWALILWGFGAIGSGLVTDFWQMAAMRMLLGLFEGPVFAAMSILLSQFFVKAERGRAFGIWNLSTAVGAFLAGPISGAILAHYDWRVMMVVEGLPAWIWAVLWWWRVPTSVSRAKWMPEDERKRVEQAIAAEQTQLKGHEGTNSSWTSLLKDVNVWLTLAGFGLINYLITGFQVWLPSALKQQSEELSSYTIGILTGLPFLVAIAGTYLNSVHSDKRGQERRLHAAVPPMLSGAFLIASVLVPHNLFWLQIASLLAVGFFMKMYLPMVFARLVEIYPRDRAIAVTALVSGLGNLFGGFVGPVISGYLKDVTSGFVVPFIVLGMAGVVGGFLLSMVKSTRDAKQA
jgi:sugar phosphate permease